MSDLDVIRQIEQELGMQLEPVDKLNGIQKGISSIKISGLLR